MMIRLHEDAAVSVDDALRAKAVRVGKMLVWVPGRVTAEELAVVQALRRQRARPSDSEASDVPPAAPRASTTQQQPAAAKRPCVPCSRARRADGKR